MLPRDNEQHGLLGAQEDTRLRLETLTGNHDMDSLGGQYLETARSAGHVLSLLSPNAGSVDDALGTNGDFFTTFEICCNYPCRVPRGILDELMNLGAAGRLRTIGERGAD